MKYMNSCFPEGLQALDPVLWKVQLELGFATPILEEEQEMTAGTHKTEWFDGDVNGSKYKLPIHEMNGHSYVLDSVEISKLEVDKEAQPRKKDDTQVTHLAA